MNLLLMAQGSKFHGIPRNGLQIFMDAYMDAYGRNIMPVGSGNFENWDIYGAATVLITQNQTVAEWGTNKATRIQSTGGSSTLKYSKTVAPVCTKGAKYCISVKFKNQGSSSVRLLFNLTASAYLPPGTTTEIYLEVVGDGTGALYMAFQTENIADSFDIVCFEPKINLLQPCPYALPQGLPSNPVDYYKHNQIQNGSLDGDDSNEVKFTGNSWIMNTSANQDNYFKLISSNAIDNMEEFTAIIPFNALSAGGTGFGRLFDKANDGALTGPLAYIGTLKQIIFARYNGNANNFKQWATPAMSAWGTNNILIMTVRRSLLDSAVTMMLNGVIQTLTPSQAGTPAIVSDATYDLYVGNRVGMNRYFDGSMFNCIMYNRILSVSEQIRITQQIKSQLNKKGVTI
jgi:hypothetical protein